MLDKKKIIELLGGEIGVNSSTEKGTEFWFTLDLDIVKAHKKSNLDIYTDNLQFPVSILVVDDNIINLKVAGIMLKKLGVEVTIANGGKEAIKLFKPQIFDLIFI